MKKVCYNENMKIRLFENCTIHDATTDMLRAIDNSGWKEEHIVIVPDKYSLITEKKLLATIGQGALFNVKVKSLTNFSCEILQELGIDSQVISSGESLLLVQKAINEERANLIYFKKSNINFCYELSKFISQLKSSLISPEDLFEVGCIKIHNGADDVIEDKVFKYAAC